MLPFTVDQIFSLWLNQFSHQFPRLDHFLYMLAENSLLKGGIVFSVFYYVWWNIHSLKLVEHRKVLITTIIAAFLAEITTIILSVYLPYRARPFTGKDISFSMPFKVDVWWSKTISSFPSDHATLFTVLGLGIFLCNKKLGWLVNAYILVFIFMPRLYLGFHYLSDVVSGVLIGSSFFFFALKSAKINKLSAVILSFSEKKPFLFYPLLFLISYQLVDLFIETREIVKFFKS